MILESFSVQPCKLAEGELKAGECIHVQAASALQAAKLAIGETLALHGTVVRARVWHLGRDYTPQRTDLFEN